MGIIAEIINRINIDFSLNMNYGDLALKAVSFLNSSELHSLLFPPKIVFLAISVIFVVVVIFVLLRTHYLQWLFIQDVVEFFTRRPYGAKRVTGDWNKVLRRLETGVESEYKLAIIEADNLMDNSLKRLGYSGATLGERLQKLTPTAVPNIGQVLESHKIRDSVVHDPDYRLSLDEAKKTLDAYSQAFKDLQIL